MNERELGILLTKVEYHDQDIKEINKKLDKVLEQTGRLDKWEQRMVGAVTVFSFIGSIVLYLGHDLLVLIKTKLGF